MLNFKLKSWEAETPFAIARIVRMDGKKPFYWHVSYHEDGFSVDGYADTFGKAKLSATHAATAAE